MGSFNDFYWKHLQARLDEMAHELTKGSLASFRVKGTWTPPVNAYRCGDAIILCVDLAGVAPETMRLRVESRRVNIQGSRPTPRPEVPCGPTRKILALEIEEGPFERDIILPVDVDPDQAQCEHRLGFFWIHLPVISPG